jgi:hypothetical protein
MAMDAIRQADPALATKIDKKATATGLSQDQMEKNLEDVWNQTTPEEQDKSANWYSEAQRTCDGLATKYGVTPEVATGVMAALSPLRDWGTGSSNDNATAAENVISRLSANQPFEVTKQMADDFNAWAAGNRSASIRAEATLQPGTYKPSDLTPVQAASTVLRDCQNPAGNGPVATAVEVFRTGNPDEVLGGPKVRSFYNNMANPSDPSNVTIDTWMIRAAADSTPVTIGTHGLTDAKTLSEWEDTPAKAGGSNAQAFLSGVSKKGVYQGGQYAQFSQAVANNAAKHGMLPSQYQAVVWTQIRKPGVWK